MPLKVMCKRSAPLARGSNAQHALLFEGCALMHDTGLPYHSAAMYRDSIRYFPHLATAIRCSRASYPHSVRERIAAAAAAPLADCYS